MSKLTHKEVLEKAIEKAVKNGCQMLQNSFVCDNLSILFKIGDYTGNASYCDAILSHDFAKALWGETECCGAPGWKHHLSLMVLEEDRIEYLRKFI